MASIQVSAQCTIQVVTTDITTETCVGSSDGSATATAAGIAPFSYLWSDGQTTAIATNLTAGTYTVTATDDVGCTGTAEAEIILDPEGIWLMFTSTPVTCNGGSDGTAYVSVMTGVAPYTYIWNDPAGTTNATPVGLAAGQYTVTVTDSNGCSNYGPVTITEPTAIVLVSTTTNESCFGSADGTASVTASGGTPGYTYLWSNGDTTATAASLTAGDYVVTVTDANGCPSTATLTVDLTNPQIVISGTSTPVSCFGGNDGTATVTVNSGNGPFSYSWSNGGTNATISGLAIGDYTVTVTGADGCTSVTTVTVPGPPELTVTTTTTINVSCNGGSDGSITVTSNGGTGSITYLWSNGETTETISSLSAGTYTVTATDGNGCTATTSTTITEPTELTATGTGTNVTVNGGNDGTATVTPSGGTPPYTYLWSDGQTTATATTLTAGTYTVTVTDDNGCTTTTIVEIPEPPSLTITPTPDTCGLNVGTATVIATGGTPGYTYLWSNGDTTQTIINLNAGDYTVTVTDAIGLTSSISTTVTEEGSTIIATTSHSNETCVGSMDGHVAVSTTGGVGLMTFLWSNDSTTAVVNNLSVGTYTVTVTDEVGCTATSTETIELSPEGIWVDITITPVSCFNGNDGSATAIVTTGVAPYTYAWSNGGDTTTTITNLIAGDYTVTVTDVNGCIGIFTATVTQPTQLIATTTSTNTTCELPNGTATVTATGGTLNYTYEWSTGDSTSTIDSLSVGTYTATVTDANGCTAVDSTTIMNTNLDIITVASTTDPSGPTAADGAIDIEVSGGISYTYIWSNGATTQDISGLTAGCYTVTVSNSIGVCQDIDTICIPDCMLILDVTTTNNTCENDTMGTATATITSNCSSTTYTYNWTTETGFFIDTTQTISGLLDGTYLVTVTDSDGYTVTGSGTITGGTGITSEAIGDTLLCHGDSTGTATGYGYNGSLNYTYLWSTGDTTQTITNLIAGTYTVTVTDLLDTTCTSISEVTIVEPPVINIISTITTTTTPGGNDGAIAITVTGGTPGYTYLWSTGDTTQNLTGLMEGCYTVTVTDMNNCMDSLEACIDQCLLTVTSTPESCPLNNNGTAMAAIINCTPPVTYAWEDSAGNMVGNTAMIMGLNTGMYYVTITDANLITKNDSVFVDYIGGPDVAIDAENISCNGLTDGAVSANPSGGTSPYSFSWEGVGGSIGNSDTIVGLPAGTYTVTVTDAVGCSTIDSVVVEEEDPITINEVITPIQCFGDSNASITVTPSGGVPSYSYQWSTSPTDVVDSIVGLGSGVYTVTVTDQNMCTAVDSFMISEPPLVTISADPDTAFTCENFLTVSATASTGADITWTNQAGLDIGTGSPFAYISIPSGISIIYAEAEDANGCTALDSIIVSQNAVDVSVTPSVSVCVGDVADLVATNNNPSQDVDYVWTPANMFVAGTDSTATPTFITSDTGTFEVYLYSINEFNCEQFDTVAISVQDTTPIIINSTQCVGLEVNYSTTSGVDMIWDFGDMSPQVTATSTIHVYDVAGVYIVTATFVDPQACLPDMISDTIIVYDDPIFDSGITLTYDSCAANSTELMYMGASTNEFNSPVMTWEWCLLSDPTTIISTDQQGSILFTASAMDILQLKIIAENGCVDTVSMPFDINIVEDSLQDVTACIGTEANLNPTPNADYSYEWLPDGPIITITNVSQSGTYSVTITDNSSAFPCAIDAEVELTVPEEILFTSELPDSVLLCEEGQINLEASSNISPIQFNWYDSNNDPLLVNSPMYSVFVDMNYGLQDIYLEAEDTFGCSIRDTVLIGDAEILIALSPSDTTFCFNTEGSMPQPGVVSNIDDLVYTWCDPNGDILSVSNNPQLIFTPTLIGEYTIKASNGYCTDSAKINIDIIDVSLDVQATATPNDILLGETVQLDVDYVMGPYTFLWSDAKNTIIGDTTSQSPEAMPDEEGDFEYEVVVTDDNGCTALSTVLVNVGGVCGPDFVFFPNVFSPNGDGLNDVLKVESEVADEVFFVIYNRWGEKVFEGNSVDAAWDGTHNGKPVSSDVYGYYMRAVCVNGEVYEEKGNVTVLR